MAVFLGGGNNVGSLKFLLFLYSNVRGDENRGIALQIIFALGGDRPHRHHGVGAKAVETTEPKPAERGTCLPYSPFRPY